MSMDWQHPWTCVFLWDKRYGDSASFRMMAFHVFVTPLNPCRHQKAFFTFNCYFCMAARHLPKMFCCLCTQEKTPLKTLLCFCTLAEHVQKEFYGLCMTAKAFTQMLRYLCMPHACLNEENEKTEGALGTGICVETKKRNEYLVSFPTNACMIRKTALNLWRRRMRCL